MKITNIFHKIKTKLHYDYVYPLAYTQELKNAYSSDSVTGGELEGKIALITGATGDIGKSICIRMLAEKVDLIIAARNKDKAEKLKEDLHDIFPEREVFTLILDLSNTESIDEACNYIEKNDLNLDILINNAGVFSKFDKARKFRELRKEDFYNVWQTNFSGTIQFTQFIAEYMVKKGISGKIINISSICANFHNFQYTPYGMSKFAILKYSKELNEKYPELTVRCIQPGSVATVMGNLRVGDNISTVKQGLHHIAIPEEIASIAAFLCTECGRYIIDEGIVASACEDLDRF